jgi:hypothetical protein
MRLTNYSAVSIWSHIEDKICSTRRSKGEHNPRTETICASRRLLTTYVTKENTSFLNKDFNT